MRATYICLDFVETVHPTAHCTVGPFICDPKIKIEKSGGFGLDFSLSLVLNYVEVSVLACRVGCIK